MGSGFSNSCRAVLERTNVGGYIICDRISPMQLVFGLLFVQQMAVAIPKLLLIFYRAESSRRNGVRNSGIDDIEINGACRICLTNRLDCIAGYAGIAEE